jgi:hypothetical protein
MRRTYLCLLLLAFSVSASAQYHKPWKFRAGAAFYFAPHSIGNNENGIGGLAGVERSVHRIFSPEAEISYSYFFGDKVSYINGNNRAFTIPVLLGAKTFLLPQLYLSPRAGAIYFQLNGMPRSRVSFAYGLASGVNFPKKTNRLNVQLGYTGFGNKGVHCGYATLAFAIIIN